MRGATLALLAALAAAPAIAQQAPAQQGGPAALTAPQQRMQACNAEASGKSLAGEARQRFMSECLSGPAAAPAQLDRSAQQDRQRACEQEATGRSLAGAARQSFLTACVAGTTGASATAPSGTGGEGRFASEAQAKRACAGAAVVWANPDSRVFHPEGSQFYGKTQQGGYMCRPAAEKAGYRIASGGRG